MADDVIELELGDPLSPKMANGHIYLPCSGSVNQAVLHVNAEDVDDSLSSKVPVQFMLVLAGGVISTMLQRAGEDRYSAKMPKNVLRDVIRLVRNTDKAAEALQSELAEDISVGGAIRGRHLGQGAKWIDYALVTVTFTCGPDDTDRSKNDKVVNKAPMKHKFDHGMEGGPGGFDHSFLSATSETAQ